MPYKRKNGYKKLKSGRYAHSRSSKTMSGRRYTTTIKTTNAFPKRMITKQKYMDAISMAITDAGATTDYYFNLNGLYDPDGSSSGHQPYGFDTAMTLYSRYRVYKCSWVITLPANTSQDYMATVLPVNGATSFSSTSQSIPGELPLAVTKIVTAGGNAVTFRGSCYLPKLNGVKPSEYKDDDRYIGTSAANPAEVMRLHIIASCVGSNMTIRPSVTLVYHAEFIDPNVLSQS